MDLKTSLAESLIDELNVSAGEKRYLKFLVRKHVAEPGAWEEELRARLIRTAYIDMNNRAKVLKILDLLGI